MITLIHGNDSLASFTALKKILDTADQLSLTRLAGTELELEDIKEALDTPSFTGPRLVLIEDLSRNRSTALLQDLKKYLPTLPKEANLILYERRLLPPESSVLTLSTNLKNFSRPGGLNVFEWADGVGKRNLKEALSGWDQLIKSGEEPEYLFLMLVRQFRLLLLLKKGCRPKVPEFVEEKLRNQLRWWGEGDLEKSYRRLLSLDRDNKKGLSPLEVSVPTFLSSIGRLS